MAVIQIIINDRDGVPCAAPVTELKMDVFDADGGLQSRVVATLGGELVVPPTIIPSGELPHSARSQARPLYFTRPPPLCTGGRLELSLLLKPKMITGHHVQFEVTGRPLGALLDPVIRCTEKIIVVSKPAERAKAGSKAAAAGVSRRPRGGSKGSRGSPRSAAPASPVPSASSSDSATAEEEARATKKPRIAHPALLPIGEDDDDADFGLAASFSPASSGGSAVCWPGLGLECPPGRLTPMINLHTSSPSLSV